MPVKVALPECVYLQKDASGRVALPQIPLSPMLNHPYLMEVRVEATDEPGAGPFARQVEAQYPPRKMTEPTLLKRPVSLNPTGPATNVPENVRCRLTVRTLYHDRDPKTVAHPELLENRVETILMFQTAAPPTPIIPSSDAVTPPRKPTMTVEPEELTLIPGKESVLRITSSDGTAPITQLAELSRLDPPLSRAIEEILPTPARQQRNADGSITFVIEYRLGSLSTPAMKAVARLGGSPIPMQTSAGSLTKRHWFCVNNPQDGHAGWLAIDWGFTYTQPVLYDDDLVPVMIGLPMEQNRSLKDSMVEWFDRARGCVHGAKDEEWLRFLDEHMESPSAGRVTLRNRLDRAEPKALHELMLKFERAIGDYAGDGFRRAVTRKVTSIYRQVFRTPPLESNKILPMELDPKRYLSVPAGQNLMAQPMSSEVQILTVEPQITLAMGEEVARNRLAAIEQNKPVREIQGQFEPNPKRWLYMEANDLVEVFCEGKFHKVTAKELVRASLVKIVELADRSRAANPERYRDQKPLTFLVLTYPNALSPGSRRMYREIATSISPNIRLVSTDLDEAVPALIYQVFVELGGSSEIGLEAFKARCRRDGNTWVMNAAVGDLGGGTFDFALIRFLVKQEDVFKPGEDRGAGGRLYVVEPTLLVSSGHMYLGGERITLRLLKVFKAVIADAILIAETSKASRSPALRRALSQFQGRFLEADSQEYRPGSLIESMARMGDETDEEYRAALTDADRIVPTAWTSAAGESGPHLALFHALRNFSDRAKIALGSSQPDRAKVNEFPLDADTAAELWKQLAKMGLEIDTSTVRPVVLTSSHLQMAQAWPIKEAAKIAVGALEAHLPTIRETKTCEPLDWLILSGQTSKLDYVAEAFRDALAQKSFFVWNRERITIDSSFTKPAAAGACYIQKRLRKGFRSNGLHDLLRKGLFFVDIRVNNLFYFTPCSFRLDAGDADKPSIELIKHGSHLLRLDGSESGKIRTIKWHPTQMLVSIRRQDYKGGPELPWARFTADELCRRAGLKPSEFGTHVKMQVEINHRQEVELLFCHGEEPHYLISTNQPSLNPSGAGYVRAGTADEPPVLLCDIALDVDAEQPGGEKIVFEAGPLTKQMHLADGTVRACRIAELEELSPEAGSCNFWIRKPDGSAWTKLGTLAVPCSDSDYPWQISATVDETGSVSIQLGAVPYWESEDPAVLRDRPGCVVRQIPNPPTSKPDLSRNPYSGVH